MENKIKKKQSPNVNIEEMSIHHNFLTFSPSKVQPKRNVWELSDNGPEDNIQQRLTLPHEPPHSSLLLFFPPPSIMSPPDW